MNLFIGILSWRSPLTLENTLSSYQKNGLLDCGYEILIFYNEISHLDKKIAEKYNIEYLGASQNIGIGKALEILVNYSRCDHFLFLENDWVLAEDRNITEKRIATAIKLLEEGRADAVRLRHRFKYGEPLYTMAYKGKELENPEYLFDSIHWRDDPDNKFPEFISKISINDEDWFSTSSHHACYTNNPCIYKTEFLKHNVLPFTFGDGVSLEQDIQPWWREQDFKICQGPGLFEHRRLDRCDSILLRIPLINSPWIRQVAKTIGLRRCHLERLGLLKPLDDARF